MYAHTTVASGTSSITINDMEANGDFYSEVGGTLSGKTITFSGTLSEDADIEYELAEETVTPYTTAQQAQWNAIKALQTYKNVTILVSSANINPVLSIVYYKDIETYINSLVGDIETLLSAI